MFGRINTVVRKYFGAVVTMLFMLFVTIPTMVFAEPSLSLPASIDISALYPFAGAIIASLVTLIVIRKSVKLSNHC